MKNSHQKTFMKIFGEPLAAGRFQPDDLKSGSEFCQETNYTHRVRRSQDLPISFGLDE